MANLREKNEILEITIKIALSVAWVMLWVGFALFTEKALFEETEPGNILSTRYFEVTSFYWWVFGGGLFLITAIGISKIVIGKNKQLLSKFGWMTREFIHDPEEAPIGQVPSIAKFLYNPINTLIIAIIFFSVVGLIAVNNQQFFFAPVPTQQQATPTAKLILATEPASTSETIGVLGLVMLFDGILFYFLHIKAKLTYSNYLVLSTILDSVFGLLVWLGLHVLRYGDSDIALTSVMTFGFFGVLITKMFGTIIFWLIWHITNNFFYQANSLYDSDTIVSLTIVVLIIIITLFSLLLITRAKKSVRFKSINLE